MGITAAQERTRPFRLAAFPRTSSITFILQEYLPLAPEVMPTFDIMFRGDIADISDDVVFRSDGRGNWIAFEK